MRMTIDMITKDDLDLIGRALTWAAARFEGRDNGRAEAFDSLRSKILGISFDLRFEDDERSMMQQA